MNKNFYRVVFNKARGMLMVVPDIAGCGQASSSPSSGLGHASRRRISALSTLQFALLMSLGCVSVVTQAAVVADGSAPGNQQATIINSANGTPQVNIQTPSSGGVSRNVYSQFDVDKRGVVLNNAHGNSQSQLAGMISGNPNLARGEAKVILNEVNSANISQLNGFVEVAGQRAQVVIANPSGITCNGCGFINANRATLTTGQVQMNNGVISGYDVNKGEIVVQGAGMDSRQQDSTDLIARAVSVNAGIWANELKVTAGRNSVDADHNVVNAKAADGSSAPGVAIDVATLGGMYANKIRLLGTEKGVGVHNAGTIGASAGDVIVNADGSISNSGTIAASQHATLTAAAINSTGTLAAGVKRDGSLGVAGNLTLNSQGELNVSGQALAADQLVASGSNANFSGSQTQAKDITLRANSGEVSTANATVAATRKITLASKGTINNNAGKVSADTLDLSGRTLLNQRGTVQQLGANDLQLTFADGINNASGTLASNSRNFTLNTAIFDNQQGSMLHLGSGDLAIFASQLNGIQGSILSNGKMQISGSKLLLDTATTQAQQLSVNADSLSHRQGKMIQTGDGATAVTVSGALDNQGGKIASNGDLNINAGSLDNQSGQLIAGQQGSMHIESRSLLNNQQGVIAAAGALSLTSVGLNNQGGLLQSGSAMALDVQAGDLNNRNSGSNGAIVSGGSLSLNAGNIDNSSGFIASSGDATLTGRAFNNQQGTLASDAAINLHSHAINNQSGKVQAGRVLAVDTQGNALTNLGGVFSAGQTLTLLTGALLNSAGQLLSSGALQLDSQGQQLDNSNGVIAAAGDAQLTTGALNNIGGQLQIAGNALINAGTIDNSSGLMRSGQSLLLSSAQLLNRNTQGDNLGVEGQSVTLNSDVIDNANGVIRATNRLAINSATSLDNRSGLVSSGAALAINGGKSLALSNTGGTLIGGSIFELNANRLSGDGRVLSQDALSLNLQQAFFNQGEVIANGNLTFNLNGQGLVNQSLMRAGGVLTLNAGSLDNQQPAEISANESHLLISGDVTNRGLLDGGLTHITATSLTNLGSGRLYGDHIALQANTLNNLAENGTAATIAARDRLDIGMQTLNNRDHALIYSGGDLAIGGLLDGNWHASAQGSVFNNHSATLESAGDMNLNIGQINNINDHLVMETVVVEQSSHHEAVLKGAVNRFDWADVDTSYKNKYGVHDAIMPDGTRGNEFYEYEYQRTITETQVKESDPGQFIAGGNLTITSNQVNNHDSRIVAGGLLSGVIGELNNIATMGERVITDIGKQIRWYAKKSGGGLGGTKTSQGKDTSNYAPDIIYQTIDLQTMRWQGNAPVNGSGTAIGDRDTTGTTVKIIDAGAISADTGQTAITPPPGQIVEIVHPGSDGNNTVIRAIGANTTLPDSSLFTIHPGNDAAYLVETDPRFTNNKQWLGSDYMQNQFTQDPNHVLRRLGDGYYEQQLIRQQVIAVSGNRYLSGYSNDESQYQALMDAGVAFGKKYGLTLGVALSTQQMALLTSDMVWLVAQTVTLPDGSTQQVLVPQLYARVKAGDVDGSGALLAGNAVSLNVNNDLTNSGHINGRSVTQLTADNLNNSGFIGGDKVDLRARTDINNIGGTLQGGSSLTAIAGRDLNSISTLGGSVGNITFDRPAGIYVQNDNGTLGLQALHDINLTASQISNSGAGSNTQIIAGNDLNLNTLTTTSSERGDWGGGNDRTLSQSNDVGSQINGGSNVSLSAGNDINAKAATVSAQDALSLSAGNDINLSSGNAAYHLAENSHQSSGGMLSKKSVTTHDEVQSQNAIGSSLSGDSVTMQAGRDLTVSGSSVVGTQDVALAAGRDLTLTTADETRQENHLRTEKKSGLSGTGGIGFTVGQSSLKTGDDAVTHSSAASTVGSTAGNVSLSAGNNLTVKGSDVLAGKDLSLSGSEVNILAAENQSTQKHTVEQKQSGLTLALSGTVGSAINTAVSTANDASKQTSGRLAALDGMKAALGGVQAYQANSLAEAGGSEGSVIGVNLSYGSQSSKSEQTLTQSQHQGSQLTAGNNLTINASKTDVNIQGAQLQAGKDVNLSAARDVNLSSSQDSQRLDGKNESQGGSIGVGINFGQGANGLSLNASVNKGKGSENGSGTTHNETTVNAGNKVNISSGRDTTLTGAQLSGNQVALDVGRNLTMRSEQDTDNYDSKQQNASAGGSISMGGGSGSVNLSRDKMHSTWSSVQEQTGIFAGSGGFDVKVGGHTQLDGAVIGSTATADKNRLDTGTLGWSNIHNQAEYEVEHQSVGISSGGNIGQQFLGNAADMLLTGLSGSGSDSSTTKAAVSAGTIVIRDKENQQQNVDELSRDAEHANQTLGKIFDKEKEQQRLAEAQKIAEIGMQAENIIRTQGDIDGLKAAKDKYGPLKENATDKERTAYLAMLRGSDEYQAEMKKYGTGSALQQGIQAATAAMQGLAGGNMAQALAGASAPYLAEVIHKMTTDASTGKVNTEANLMAHAVLGAVVAQLNGNSALAGAAGASMGEFIAQQLYPGVARGDLTEDEKQKISALATLAAGLAGGVVGDSKADATAGAQAGKNAAENNALRADDEKQRQDAKWSLPYLEGEKKQQAEKLIGDLNAKDKAFNDAVDAACKSLSSAACQGMRQELSAMGKSYDQQMDGQYIGNMGSVYKDGKGQVDALIWQYATADAKAERDANVNRIAENWGVSKQTASVLYDSMAVVHTTAAIGGAAYGMKGISSVAKGGNSAVESEKAALDRISQNAKDTVNLNSKQNYSVLDQQAAKSSVIIEQDKLKYLFGEVNSSAHNTPRSTQLAQSMNRLGIPLDDAGAKLIMEHISQVPKTSGNIVNVYANQFGKFEVRESLLMGPSGKATKLETSFEIMDNGSRRFITTIPKDGKK